MALEIFQNGLARSQFFKQFLGDPFFFGGAAAATAAAVIGGRRSGVAQAGIRYVALVAIRCLLVFVRRHGTVRRRGAGNDKKNVTINHLHLQTMTTQQMIGDKLSNLYAEVV